MLIIWIQRGLQWARSLRMALAWRTYRVDHAIRNQISRKPNRPITIKTCWKSTWILDKSKSWPKKAANSQIYKQWLNRPITKRSKTNQKSKNKEWISSAHFTKVNSQERPQLWKPQSRVKTLIQCNYNRIWFLINTVNYNKYTISIKQIINAMAKWNWRIQVYHSNWAM